jgi:cobalt-zinc-cadmium efflux system outer membrane protein
MNDVAAVGAREHHHESRDRFPLAVQCNDAVPNPSLELAIKLASERAIVVADAQAELGAAYAHGVGARVSAVGNPSSDIQVERGVTESPVIQALSYTYVPIDVAGQRGTRINEAERLIDWRKLGVLDARATAASEVVSAYGAMLLVSARISEAAAGEQAAQEEARYFAGRLQAKDTMIYEASLAEAEVSRWAQTHAAARLQFIRASARFGELTGMLNIAPPPPDAALAPPSLQGTWDEAYVARSIERSPILTRLDAEERYWGASLTRYQRERVPPVSLELIVGRGSTGELRLGGGALLTWPITRRYQEEIARAQQGRTHAANRRTLYRTIVEARLRAARAALLTLRSKRDGERMLNSSSS